MRIFHALGSLMLVLVVAACNAKPQSATIAPEEEKVQKAEQVQLTETEVVHLPSVQTGRKYDLWISFPADYDNNRKYPVVFVLDAHYAFPLIRSIRNLLGQRGQNIEDFILIGLPPETGLTSKESRSRDYTFSDPKRNPSSDPSDYIAAHYGEAEAFREYLETQVIPYARDKLNADTTRSVFVGHSYGGLFGAYVLMTKPTLFSKYILGSPSLFFNKKDILKYEKQYAASHADLPAQVTMYAGEFETFGPTPRHFTRTDLVGAMHSFETLLKSRKYPGLKIESHVLPGEDHFTIFPNLVSRGLLWALPGRGPYSSG